MGFDTLSPMTLAVTELALYAAALFVLFLTPGPVWVALTARALSGGFHAAWPLALGVAVGDVLWPLLAILGIAWVSSFFADFMALLRWVAALVFLVMGALLIRHADKSIGKDSRLTRPGAWAGFSAGLAVILGNPKAILFYMGVLPGFFDLTQLGSLDVVLICLVSLLVPLLGNLGMALGVDRARRLLTSPKAVKRTNLIAGALLVGVGLVIPFT